MKLSQGIFKIQFKWIYTLSIIIFVAACTTSGNKENNDIVLVDSVNVSKVQINSVVIDTVLEPNSPDFLDSNQHQMFIDTTRNSKYYNQIINWKPNEYDSAGVDYYLNELIDSFEVVKVNLENFPRNWISIHLLDGKYVAYNPMNGIDWRFTLTDSSVNHYRMESDADAISKIISFNSHELVLELKTRPQKNKNQTVYFRIKKTKVSNLYSVQFADSKTFEVTEEVSLVTPLEHLTKYDLVVCDAQQLIVSIVQFDKVKRNSVE